MKKKITNILMILFFAFVYVFSEVHHFDYQQIIALCFIAILILFEYVKKLYILVPLILAISAVPMIFEETRLLFMLTYLPVIWLLLANKVTVEFKDQYYPKLVSISVVMLSLAVNFYYLTQSNRSLSAPAVLFNKTMFLLCGFAVFAIVQWVKHSKLKPDKKTYNLWPLFIVYLITLFLQVPVGNFYNVYAVGIYLLLPSAVFIAVLVQQNMTVNKAFAK